MPTVPVELPDAVNQFVETKVVQRGYSTASEFIVDVLRACQLRDSIENKLLEAIDSNDFDEVRPEFWERLRARAVQKSEPDGE